jgi:hypothetical protein
MVKGTSIFDDCYDLAKMIVPENKNSFSFKGKSLGEFHPVDLAGAMYKDGCGHADNPYPIKSKARDIFMMEMARFHELEMQSLAAELKAGI